jgi:hypothetical protein
LLRVLLVVPLVDITNLLVKYETGPFSVKIGPVGL